MVPYRAGAPCRRPSTMFDVEAAGHEHSQAMGHLPIDSNSTADSDQHDPVLAVSQVAGLVKNALVESLPEKLRVVGEVSNLTDRTHWFFSLKDEQAVLRCVCFASAARRIRIRLSDGMQVVATGRVDFYDAQGQVQLYVDSIELVGQGTLELRLRQLMEQLRELDYFDPQSKKPLPLVPRCVAVVTSRSAAALQDVVNTAQKRFAGCRLVLVDVRVQGEVAAPQIAQAIGLLSKYGRSHGIDAIILTRGGGSIEDLWAFNDRRVADALHRCSLPVVAAIGHETDTTIAELVADLRCATPTQAAMALVPDRLALQQQVSQLSGRLTLLLRRQWEHDKQRVMAAARHPLFRQPQRLSELARKRLEAGERRMQLALSRELERHRAHLDGTERQLSAVNPANVLDRGYSYTLGPDGCVLRRAVQAKPNDLLTTVLVDGRIHSRVESASSLKNPRHHRKGGYSGKEPGLFG